MPMVIDLESPELGPQPLSTTMMPPMSLESEPMPAFSAAPSLLTQPSTSEVPGAASALPKLPQPPAVTAGQVADADPSSERRELCKRFFRKSGTCKAKNCRFLHELPSGATNQKRTSIAEASGYPVRAEHEPTADVDMRFFLASDSRRGHEFFRTHVTVDKRFFRTHVKQVGPCPTCPAVAVDLDDP